MQKKSKASLLIISFLLSTTFTSYGHTSVPIDRTVQNKISTNNVYSTCPVRHYRKATKSKDIEEIIKEIRQAAKEEDAFMKEIGASTSKKNKSTKSIEAIIEEIRQAAREEDAFMKEIGMYKKDSKDIEKIIAEIRQALREEDAFMKEIGMYKKDTKNKSSKTIEQIIAEIRQAAREEDAFMKEIGAYKKTFSDIGSHWAKDYIEMLATKNIISGLDNNKFNPEGYMTRAQIATIFVKGLNLDMDAYENTKVFEDVAVDSWYSKFASVSYSNNLIKGSNGQFKPEKEISGEELIQIFVNAYEKKHGIIQLDSTDINTTEDISDWAKTALAKAKQIGVLDKVLDPLEYKGKVKRAQVCVFVSELIK